MTSRPERMDQPDYNTRLFSGGLRGRLHYARFHWLQQILASRGLGPRRVIELGCFDAKTVEFLPSDIESYVGCDANWEGGLDLARSRLPAPRYEFYACRAPEELAHLEDRRFDLAIAMETLLHMPPELAERYIAFLARVTEGLLVATYPNEKGAVFLGKYLAKRFARRLDGADGYALGDIVSSTLGRCHAVGLDGRKGFDYAAMNDTIGRHFHIEEVVGLPFRGLPPSLNFTVGVVARGSVGAAPG